MSYSKSKKAVRRVLSYLDSMLHSDKSTIRFQVRNPQSTTYDIRNGIYASQFYPDTAKYKNLNNIFRIRIYGTSVICERRLSDSDSASNFKQILDDSKELIIDEVSSTIEIIAAVIKNKSADKLVFPDANTTTCDSIPLERWCKSNQYQSYVGDKQVTLIKFGYLSDDSLEKEDARTNINSEERQAQ